MGKMTVIRLGINFLSRILTILLNWIILEAFLQENIFRYITPAAMGFEIWGLLNLIVVFMGSFLWLLTVDYTKVGINKLRNCIKNRGLKFEENIKPGAKRNGGDENEAVFPGENIQAESQSVFSRRLSSAWQNSNSSTSLFCKLLKALFLEMTSSIILMTYASDLLAQYQDSRLVIISMGTGIGILHIRQAINSKTSQVTDIPCALSMSMLIRFSTLTVGLIKQSFLPSFIFASLVVGFKLITLFFPPKHDTDHATDPNNENEENVVSNQPMGFRIRVMTQCSSFNYVTALVYSSSVGTLGWMTSYIAWSPSTLSRWSDSKFPLQSGVVLNISLTVGCLVAMYLNQQYQKPTSSVHNFQSFTDVIITSLVIALWAIGVYLQFDVISWKSNVGGCLLLFVFPSIWVLCLKPLNYLKLGNPKNRGLFITFLLGCGTMGLAFYIVGVFCVIGFLTEVFWNRMGAVFWIASFILFIPIFGRSTIYVYNCIAVARSEFSLENVENFNFSALFKKNKEVQDYENHKRGKNRKNLTECVILVTILVLVIIRGISLDTEPSEVSANKNSIKVLSWNILGGRNVNGKHNYHDITRVLKVKNPDIIGLQESDAIQPYLSCADYVYYFAKQLGMHANYGPNPIHYGGGDVAILSKYKIIKKHSELLPTPDSRIFNYGLSSVSILLPIDAHNKNTVLTIVNVHLAATDLKNLNITYMTQINRTIEYLKNTPDPVIVTGDFNIELNDSRIQGIYSEAMMKNAYPQDINTTNTTTYMVELIHNKSTIIDHIYYRGLKLKNPIKIFHFDQISDHYPIMAEFSLDL